MLISTLLSNLTKKLVGKQVVWGIQQTTEAMSVLTISPVWCSGNAHFLSYQSLFRTCPWGHPHSSNPESRSVRHGPLIQVHYTDTESLYHIEYYCDWKALRCLADSPNEIQNQWRSTQPGKILRCSMYSGSDLYATPTRSPFYLFYLFFSSIRLFCCVHGLKRRVSVICYHVKGII